MRYENFSEAAEDFVGGESWTHRLSDHSHEGCRPWQHGIREFAAFLDRAGVPLGFNTDDLFEEMTTFKPEKYTDRCWARAGNPPPEPAAEEQDR